MNTCKQLSASNSDADEDEDDELPVDELMGLASTSRATPPSCGLTVSSTAKRAPSAGKPGATTCSMPRSPTCVMMNQMTHFINKTMSFDEAAR
jgi:hypothetical protein